MKVKNMLACIASGLNAVAGYVLTTSSMNNSDPVSSDETYTYDDPETDGEIIVYRPEVPGISPSVAGFFILGAGAAITTLIYCACGQRKKEAREAAIDEENQQGASDENPNVALDTTISSFDFDDINADMQLTGDVML